jgi:pimeloyl-ACP methyl ester carboxylesterase
VHERSAKYGVAGLTGPTVVFLHGWAVTNRTYKSALKRLVQRGANVFAPALPGFGGTEPLADAESDLEGYAKWVASFLDAVAISEPIVLIGHSFGGGVAIRVAHDHPERVRALVLVNSIGGSAWRQHGSLLQTMRERPLWDWGMHFPADIWPMRQARRVLPVILRDAVTNAFRDPRAFLHIADIARTADLTTELEVLRDRGLPVIVVWGSQDHIVTRDSIDSLISALGAPTVIEVSGSHSWLLADPEAFGEIMTNVLDIAARAGSLPRPLPRSKRA